MPYSKIASIGTECAACGCCVPACPVRALSVFKGLSAKVDAGACVGCGRCERACPAGVIAMTAKKEAARA